MYNNEQIDTELLISMVEARPCLWDKSIDDYKDKIKTNAGWKEVCSMLKENFEELNQKEKTEFGKTVLKKWTNVRDSFRKYLKQLKTKSSGDGASTTKQYVFYEQLRFLIKNLEERPTTDTFSPAATETCVPEESSNSSRSTLRTSTTCYRKKRKLDEVDQRMLKALEDGENRHLSFCKGFLPTIQDFTEEETMDFQMGVLQLIKDIKRQRHNPILLTTSSHVTNLPSNYQGQLLQQLPLQQCYQSPLYNYPPLQTFRTSQTSQQAPSQFTEHISAATENIQLSLSSPSSVVSVPGSDISIVDFT